MNILEVVLNEPLNPYGPQTYRVGKKADEKDAHATVIGIDERQITGSEAYMTVYDVQFDNGYMRRVHAHGAQSVLYGNEPVRKNLQPEPEPK